jgi:hypothetical protein
MRKLIIALSMLMLVITAFGQENKIDEKTIANMTFSELDAYQKVLRVQQAAQSKVEIPSVNKLQEYALVGKALGQAFKECWSTVSVDAERFAQSPAGKWTAFLITWKVMGKDAIDLVKTTVRWTVGSCLFLVITPFMMFAFWRNCITRKVILITERTSFFNVKKTYDKIPRDPVHAGYAAVYGIVYLIFGVVTCFMMFV